MAVSGPKKLWRVIVVISFTVLISTAGALLGRPAPAGQKVIAAIPRFCPPHYICTDNIPGGFAVELMNLLVADRGLSVDYRIYDSLKEALEAVKKGQADLIPDLGISKARAEFLEFSDPVETQEIFIFIRASSSNLISPANLKGRPVAVLDAGIGQRLAAKLPQVKQVPYQDISKAFFDLLAGQVDALVYAEPTILALAEQAKLTDLITTLGPPLKEVKRAIGVSKYKSGLVREFNLALKNLADSGNRSKLYIKYFAHRNPFWTARRVFTVTASIGLLLLLLLGGWRYISVTRLNRRLAESISEKDAIQKNLEDQRQELALITDSMPVLIGYLDRDQRYRYANLEHVAWFGKSRDEIIGSVCPRVTGESMYRVLAGPIEKSLSGELVVMEGKVRLGKDRERRIEARLVPRFDDHGRVEGVFTLIQDISRRYQAELRLKKEERKYRSLTENLRDIIARFDRDKRFTFLNSAGLEVVSQENEDPLNSTCRELGFDPAGCDNLDTAVDLVFETGRPATGAVELEQPAKENIFSWRLFPEADEKGRIVSVLGVGRDITEEMTAEKNREKLEGQLRQSQKLESIGCLAGGVAHDFNNLLSAIIGYAELTRECPTLTEAEKGYIDEILEAGFRAKDLTGQLLAFSRKQILELKPINLNKVLANVRKIISRLLGEDIAVSYQFGEDLATTKADFHQLEQVIINLAVNARDAMPRGGELAFKTANVVLTEEYCAQRVEVDPGPYVMLTVSDTGQGMDRETAARAFEPFFTTKAKNKGTGLGLATIHGIVKQHGGHIALYTEPGQGSTFRVYLPAIQEPAVELKTRESKISMLGGDETILVVEDDNMVRNYVVKLLTGMGYQVMEAGDPNQALEMVDEAADRKIDLILTDVIMPGMSGKALSDKLAEKLPGTAVIFTSGYTDDIIGHHGIVDQAVNFISKPFSKEQLAGKIRAVLDGLEGSK